MEVRRSSVAFQSDLYFQSLHIIGPILLLNIFLAILLGEFSYQKLEDTELNIDADFTYNEMTIFEKAWFQVEFYFDIAIQKIKTFFDHDEDSKKDIED